MWEASFDESMLDGHAIIIHCPDKSLVYELMETLERYGVRWYVSNEPPTIDSRWDEFSSETCYWVEDGKMTYGTVEGAKDGRYSRHIKSTFLGTKTSDFDIATDDELRSLLGI